MRHSLDLDQRFHSRALGTMVTTGKDSNDRSLLNFNNLRTLVNQPQVLARHSNNKAEFKHNKISKVTTDNHLQDNNKQVPLDPI